MKASISRRGFIKQSTLLSIGLSPTIDALSKILNVTPEQGRKIISYGFRLTQWQTLLNLEFYFVNMELHDRFLFKRTRLKGFYDQEECYMIVRLPQQHIAEQSIDISGGLPNDSALFENWTAITRIAGYSYLVFRIVFEPEKEVIGIRLSPTDLMDWNNKRFQLVVKQQMDESLFEIKVGDALNCSGPDCPQKKENNYPLGYTSYLKDEKPSNSSKEIGYDYDAFPKVYGEPVTALEFPWRLILSPRLPDQDRFKWQWEMPEWEVPDKKSKQVELWHATLRITENPEYEKLLTLRKQFKKKGDTNSDESKEVLTPLIKKIELAIIGSPDSEKEVDPILNYKEFELIKNEKGESLDANGSITSGETSLKTGKILPNGTDKKKLVELYIKYKLVARTEKLTMSPFGVSIFLELQNSKIEDTINSSQNDILSWKHLISFGRDEEVEVVKLMIDKEAGHKFLHIRTTQRRTKDGVSYLDYREYVMPLENSKDYTQHNSEEIKNLNDSTKTYKVTKFNAPFKKLNIIDTSPKRIQPLTAANYITITMNNKPSALINDIGTHSGYKDNESNPEDILAFIPKEPNGKEYIDFTYEATDWKGKVFRFKKKIQAIPLSTINLLNIQTQAIRDQQLNKIENLFQTDELDNLQSKLSTFNNVYNSTLTQLEVLSSGIFQPSEQFIKWKNLLQNEKISSFVGAGLSDFMKMLNDYRLELTTYRSTIESAALNLRTNLNANNFDIFTEEVEIKINVLRASIDSIAPNGIQQIEDAKQSLLVNFNLLSFGDLRSIDRQLISTIKKQWDDISKLQKQIPNIILTFRQKIGFAVSDLAQGVQEGLHDDVSDLETELLVFKGELKRDFENKINFFNEFASVPQLKEAKSYINALNKIVNEDIPVSFRYADDYIQNQLDLTKLDVQNNASRVFAEVLESSKNELRGKMRQAAIEMGGYINPELPVEYLTYLKDLKSTPQQLINDIKDQFKELQNLASDLKENYNDLVFIGKEAKDQFNQVKRFSPETFFKGLEAKILGSISLKDILGLDFEVPRLTNLPEKIIYNFSTDKIIDKDLSLVKFYAKNKGIKTTLVIYIEKAVVNPREYRSFTRLSNFTIAVKLGSTEVLALYFGSMEVSSPHEQARKTSIHIDDVAFGGPLDFIGKLAEAIKMPGSGLRVQPSLKEISVGYAFALPGIGTPAFNFSNMKFDIGLAIPLPTSSRVEPIRTTFSINRPDDKFLISVGIFGGRGHFVMEATPDKIQVIDCSLEFGGYLGINLGIASGHVYLFAGIRYRAAGGDIYFSGYLICGGGITVLGFISISVTFLMALEYQRIGGQASLYGTASLSFSVKIAFFKKSFSISYSKRITGAQGERKNPDGIATLDQKEIILYADIEPRILLDNSETDPIPTTETLENRPTPDTNKFTDIYTRELWKQYCETFNY